MNSPLSAKLNRLCSLNLSDDGLPALSAKRRVEAHEDILQQGAEVTRTTLLLNGVAFRYKMIADGCRAIIGFLVPGDFVNMIFPSHQKLDYAVGALTSCEVVDVPCRIMQTLATTNPELADALWACAELDGAIQRDWLAITSYPAEKRLAHLFCELRARFEAVGLADGECFPLPMKQQDLADALGLSVVHVNRVMQVLRRLNLIETVHKNICIPDLGRLEEFSGFASKFVPDGGPRRLSPR